MKTDVTGAKNGKKENGIVLDVAIDINDQCQALKKRIKPIMSVKRIVYQPTNSFYQESTKAYTKHGLNCPPVIFDELYAL